MILKKTNSILGLAAALALLLHMGYNCFAFLTFYYDPVLKVLTALPFIVVTCCHGVLGMCAVFLMGDGTRADLYPSKNRKTIIQRVSAAFIFPLLILHLKTFELLQSSAQDGKWLLFVVVLLIQIIFYAIVTAHTAVSVSRACITLGLVSDEKRLETMDRIVSCIYGIAFIVTSVAVIRGELVMFV